MGSDNNVNNAQRYHPWAVAQLVTPKKTPENLSEENL